MIILETNRYKLEYNCVARAIGWWIQILEMPGERLVKSFYNKLFQLNHLKSNKMKYKWASQIEHIVGNIGLSMYS